MNNTYISYANTLSSLGSGEELWQNLLNKKHGLSKASTVYENSFEDSDYYIGNIKILDPKKPRIEQILDLAYEEILPVDMMKKCDLILTASHLGDIEDGCRGNPLKSFNEFMEKRLGSSTNNLIASACSGGLSLLIYADTLIKAGMYDNICLFAIDSLGYGRLIQHIALKTQSKNIIKPFDIKRDGTSFGEGMGVMIISNEKGLKKLKVDKKILIKGTEVSCDAQSLVAPPEDGRYMAQAIKKAIKDTSEIDLIKVHGSGTKIGDLSESNAINLAFGSNNIPVCGFKGAIGNTTGATGLMEAAILCWSLEKNIILPTVGCHRQDPKIKLNITKVAQQKEIKNALALNFGFGGINSAAVLKKV